MPNIKKLIAIFLILSTTFTWAQTKFEKGYFLNKENQKVACLIKNNKWLESPINIIYKMTEGGEELVADPSTIKGFQVNGGAFYQTLTAEFPTYKDKIAQQNSNAEITTVERTVFIKQLLDGNASLFEYRIGNEHVYIYGFEGNTPKVLLYNEYLGKDNRIRTNNVFRNQLYESVNCGSNQNIQELKYTRKSLEAYFVDFNTCSDPKGELEEQSVLEKPKSKLSVVLWAGAQRYDFAVALERQILDYDKTITPKIGVELENIFPFNNNKWALFLSAAFTSHSSEALITNDVGFERVGSEFELSRIENVIGGRHYMFFNDKSSLFIEGGVVFDFDLKTNVTGITFSGQRLDESQINFTVMSGVGYSYNQNFYARLGYYFDQNILNYIAAFNNALSRLSFTIGYKL